MLVAHSNFRDNGDASVLVHNADWAVEDQCWLIKGVKERGVTVGYTLMKSQVVIISSWYKVDEIGAQEETKNVR